MSYVRREEAHSLYDLFSPMLGLLGRVVEQVRGGGHGDEELEALRELLEKLDDDLLRGIAIGKLEGYQNRELAARLGTSQRRIERKLQLIRQAW